MKNTLPINKIFLAGFAFALTHWRKIGEISIFPLMMSLPLLWIFPDLLTIITPLFQGEQPLEITLPNNTLMYLILFLYGYFLLSINMYRLVILGEQSVNAWIPIIKLRQIAGFMALHLLIGLATILPAILTGIGALQLIMSFLIIPITLNFVNIAIQQPSKYKWHLPFTTQMNLFFLQIILPALVGLLFSTLGNILGLETTLSVAVKVIVFYWTLVTLGLCYQLILANPTTNNTN